jgi:hypothetical protein
VNVYDKKGDTHTTHSTKYLVLMGQVIPEAAPPFARIVNIVFLIASLLFFLFYLLKKNKV